MGSLQPRHPGDTPGADSWACTGPVLDLPGRSSRGPQDPAGQTTELTVLSRLRAQGRKAVRARARARGWWERLGRQVLGLVSCAHLWPCVWAELSSGTLGPAGRALGPRLSVQPARGLGRAGCWPRTGASCIVLPEGGGQASSSSRSQQSLSWFPAPGSGLPETGAASRVLDSVSLSLLASPCEAAVVSP